MRGSYDEVVLTTMVISMSSFCDRMPLVSENLAPYLRVQTHISCQGKYAHRHKDGDAISLGINGTFPSGWRLRFDSHRQLCRWA